MKDKKFYYIPWIVNFQEIQLCFSFHVICSEHSGENLICPAILLLMEPVYNLPRLKLRVAACRDIIKWVDNEVIYRIEQISDPFGNNKNHDYWKTESDITSAFQ